MSALDFLLNKDKPSEGLGGFDEREATDLGLHVAQCARRYDDLRRSIDKLQFLTWLVILILLASNVIDVKAILGWLL